MGQLLLSIGQGQKLVSQVRVHGGRATAQSGKGFARQWCDAMPLQQPQRLMQQIPAPLQAQQAQA